MGNKPLQGIGILLLSIYCILLSIFVYIYPSLNFSADLMAVSVPIALVGIGRLFWQNPSRTEGSE
jgi:hypothetical protein